MRLPPPDTLINDLLIALALLTRLPVPHANLDDTSRAPAKAAWAYPLAGLLLASIATLVGWLALWLGVPVQITALLILAMLTLSTGAMHEDGLADCADGFWGGYDRKRRLEIMKDSQIGTYGVLALITTFALRWSALVAALSSGMILAPLIATAVISRSAMVYVMDALPTARDTGLSHMTGSPGKQTTRAAAGIATLAALITFGWSGFWLIVIATLVVIGVSRLAQNKIGGQTGDVLGATQQLSEAALWITIAAMV